MREARTLPGLAKGSRTGAEDPQEPVSPPATRFLADRAAAEQDLDMAAHLNGPCRPCVHATTAPLLPANQRSVV